MALVIILSVLLVICLAWLLKKDRRGSTSKLAFPPGPRPLPIIGNLLHMTNNPHISLANLSKTYGHIMRLKLGSVTTIVLSSAEAVKEALQSNDQALAGRAVSDTMIASGHHESSVVWLPTSARWRKLRRICATQLFTPQRLDATKRLRFDKVQELMGFVHENCSKGQAVDIGRVSFITLLNMVSNTFFSINFGHYDSDVFQEFYEFVVGVVETSGLPNMAGFFPFLGPFDLQGTRKQMKNYLNKMFRVFQKIIDERVERRMSLKEGRNRGDSDLLDSLLNINEENDSEFSFEDIKHLLVIINIELLLPMQHDLFIAGIDTSSSTVEWAMSELLRNPDMMSKAQEEIRCVVGEKGTVEESDIADLPYLQAIIKETFRIHPPVPFLIPRRAQSDVKLCDYLIPNNTQVLINVWAIGRDSNIWTNPDTFQPDRFLGREIDVKGKYFELFPFGGGRRLCPGLGLANRIVHLVVASLLLTFDWKLEDGITMENLDMAEAFGLSLHKNIPLRTVPIKIRL